ncbi:MAG: NUDIX domain-containing protein [Clostridia bacterium]|nr:NUDIX domain-containing protein [Clostridia bacterium]MBN2883340.1 NUDIX domain-containing protein [Clostridia bacterium]
MRQPWNVFVYIYRLYNEVPEYLLLKRSDDGVWQGAAGGGETGENPPDAALRELKEETGVILYTKINRLDTISYMEKTLFQDNEKWDSTIYVIPMYYFYTEHTGEVKISCEHTDFGWFGFEEAMKKLFWHDNKVALWELNERLKKNLYKIAQ